MYVHVPNKVLLEVDPTPLDVATALLSSDYGPMLPNKDLRPLQKCTLEAPPEGSKYPNMEYVPQSIISIPHRETIDTPHMGALDP